MKYEIKFYRGLPVVENYNSSDANKIQRLIQKIEMESELPNTLLEWKGEIFKDTSEVDEYLDGDDETN